MSARPARRISAREVIAGGIARRLRAWTVLIGVGIIALTCEIGIREAGQRAARRARLTLRISVERAIAQSRPFIAGEAERVMRPERAYRRACAQRQRKCGESERNCGEKSNSSTHFMSPITPMCVRRCYARMQLKSSGGTLELRKILVSKGFLRALLN